DAVVQQEAHPIHRLDLAAGADVAGVVEIPVEVRSADEDGRAARLPGDPLNRILGCADEPGPQKQVLRRIARDGELREDDEVRGVGFRRGEPPEDQFAVALEVADDGVDLGERQAHVLSLAVCDSEAKTQAPNCRTYSQTPCAPNMLGE